MPLDSLNWPEPEVVAILRRAKARIEKPENWCQGPAYIGRACCAASALGEAVSGRRWFGYSDHRRNVHAVAFLRAAAIEVAPGIRRDAGIEYVWVNDETDHATVMRMYDRAIELALSDAAADVGR